MMKKAKTFHEREFFFSNKPVPFKTVEEYTEWFLEKREAFDLLKEAESLNEAFRKYHLKEVSLEVANQIQVDIISVVESEINEEWWENKADTDQYLVTGQIREVNQETTLFLQGFGWAER